MRKCWEIKHTSGFYISVLARSQRRALKIAHYFFKKENSSIKLSEFISDCMLEQTYYNRNIA